MSWMRLAQRDNALNLIRFVLATLVLVSHSWPVATGQDDPRLGDMKLGTWCVAGFFCISGFLISGSRLRTSPRAYLWRRVLRIFPAFWVALLVTAFVAAPLAAMWRGGGPWRLGDAVNYVASNGLLWMDHYEIGSTLHTVPYPNVWNASLWTLFPEFGAYIAIGLILTGAWMRRRSIFVVGGLFVLLTALDPLVVSHLQSVPLIETLILARSFLAGALLMTVIDRLPCRTWLAGMCLIVLIVLGFLGLAAWLAPLPFAYLLLWFGVAAPWRPFTVNDISYGVYVYAFPVQQLFAVSPLRVRDPWVLIACALPVVLVLATLSWRFVEKPALALKRLVPSGRAPAAAWENDAHASDDGERERHPGGATARRA